MKINQGRNAVYAHLESFYSIFTIKSIGKPYLSIQIPQEGL